MKLPGDDLFTLIRSLGQTEKRYFRLVSFPYGNKKGNKYLRLFDKIEKQKKYNEAAVKKYFSADPFLGKHFKKAKLHLYNLLLTSLERYHTDESSGVQRMLNQSRILFRKGLYKQSYKLLVKAKKIAGDIEYFPALLEVTEQERHLVSVNMEFRGDMVRQMPAELKANMAKLANLHSVWDLQAKIFRHFSNNELVQTKKQLQKTRLEGGSLLKKQPVPISKKAGTALYNTLGVYYLKLGQFQKAQLNCRKALSQYEGQKNENSVINQVMITGNYISACLGLKEFDKVINEVNRLLVICDDYPGNKRVKPVQRYLCHAGVNAFISSGDFQRGITFAEQVKKYFTDAILRDKIVLAINTAILSFGAGNYRQALVHTNGVINIPENDNPVPVTIYWCKMLQLIALWELRDYELLGYKTRSFYQYLRKRKQVHQKEKIFLGFLKKHFTTEKDDFGDAKVRAAFSALKKELGSLYINSDAGNAAEYFDLASWIESKVTGKTFAELIRERSVRKKS